MEKLAIIYDRASTHSQKDNWSRDDALREGRRLAELYGYNWELRQEVRSGEELSNRPVMMGILDDIEAGKIHAIICQELSRLSRDEDTMDGAFIRKICRDNGVPVITQGRVYNFEDDHDDTIADFEFLMAKYQKRLANRQTIRGRKEKARQGGYNGGRPAFGYKLVWTQESESDKPKASLAIDPEKVSVVRRLFELYILYGGRGAAKRLNEEGYRKPYEGKNGGKFTSGFVLRVIENPLYAGFYVWGKNIQSRHLKDFESKWIFKKELQIISTETWEKAQAVRKSRSVGHRSPGALGRYAFTGIIGCETCGGLMVGYVSIYKGRQDRVVYRCYNDTRFHCPHPKYNGERIVAEVVIPLASNLIRTHLGLEDMLGEAAKKYGTTQVEEDLRESLQVELHKVKDQKNRIVKSIASGTLDDMEAKEVMNDIRDKEARLNRELATLGQKEKIRKEYQRAINVLKEQNIEATLEEMMIKRPQVFRRILLLIFKPNSVKVRTMGGGKRWWGELISYELTDEFKSLLPDGIDLCNLYCNKSNATPVVGDDWGQFVV